MCISFINCVKKYILVCTYVFFFFLNQYIDVNQLVVICLLTQLSWLKCNIDEYILQIYIISITTYVNIYVSTHFHIVAFIFVILYSRVYMCISIHLNTYEHTVYVQ